MSNKRSRIKSLEQKLRVDNESFLSALLYAYRKEYGREPTEEDIEGLKRAIRINNDMGIFTIEEAIEDLRRAREADQEKAESERGSK